MGKKTDLECLQNNASFRIDNTLDKGAVSRLDRSRRLRSHVTCRACIGHEDLRRDICPVTVFKSISWVPALSIAGGSLSGWM